MIGEQEQILFSLFQVRDTDRELIDTMVQVLTEISFLDRLPQVLVRSGYQTYVDGDLLIAPDRLHLALLQGTQKLDLHLIRQVPDLIQKYRTALGRHKRPSLVLDRPCKRTFHVAEELGSRQFLGDSAAIHGDKRSLATITLLVNPTGDVLLTGTASAGHQYRHIRRSHQTHMLIKLAGRLALPLDIKIRGRRNRDSRRSLLLHAHKFLDLSQQLIRVQRLGNIIRRSQLHRLNRRLYLRITGHHDKG